MRKLFRSIVFALLTVTILLSGLGLVSSFAQQEPSPSPGETSPSPEQSVPDVPAGEITSVKALLDAMDNVFQGITDYSLMSYIRLPNGTSVIDYRCVRPSKVRTEVIDGTGKGMSVLYDPDAKKDQVKAKKGAFRVWRSIERLKLQGTPAVESLFDMIYSMMKDPKNSTRFQGKVILTAQLGDQISMDIKNTNGAPLTGTPSPSVTETPSPSETGNSSSSPTVEPTETGNPLPSPTVDPEAGKVPSPDETISPSPGEETKESPPPRKNGKVVETKTLEKTCYLVEITGEEFTDVVAVDAEKFWCIYAKRMKGNDLVFEAVVEEVKTNTSPKMDL